MGKKSSSRRARNVYDPTITVTDVDRLEKTNLFAERDPLAMGIPPEMEDIRSQSDIRDARLHNDDRSTRIRWKYILPIAILGLVAIIVTAVMVGKSDGSDNQDIKFLPTPWEEALSEACDPFKIQTAEGLKDCQDMCQPSDCCRFPTSMDMSCLFGNERKCQEYHKHCYILSKGTQQMSTTPSFPLATQEVYEACSGDSLATIDGHNSCARVCEPAQCCYRTGEAGSCSADPKCLGYAPCLALRATTHEHDDIARLVNAKCSDDNVKTTEGSLQCESICAQSLCCFVEDDTCDDIDDYSFCDQYDQCEDIVRKGLNPDGDDDKIILDPPTGNLAQLCSLDNIKTNLGRAKCEDMCQVADCCNTGACIDDNIDVCFQYQHQCMNLYLEEPETVGAPPSNIADVCDESNIRFPTGEKACELLCHHVTCCYASGSDACYAGNELNCNEYIKYCKVLEGFDVDTSKGDPEGDDDKIVLDLPSGNLAQICSLDNIKTNLGRAECEDMCKVADCCNTGACFDDNIDVCSQYQSHCSNLYLVEPETVGAPPNNIADVCGETNIQVAAGRQACELICRDVTCCIASGGDACYEGNELNCNKYIKYCKVLDGFDVDATEGDYEDNDDVPFSDQQLDMPPANIAYACSTSNIETTLGIEQCEFICEKAVCCQADLWGEDSCYDNNAAACDAYKAACQNLDRIDDDDDSYHINPPPSTIGTICGSSNVQMETGRIECQELCSAADCCQLEIWDSMYCRENNEDTCNQYDSYCSILDSYEVKNDENVRDVPYLPDPPSNLSFVCSQTNIATPIGRSNCDALCAQAACCDINFRNEGSCIESNHQTCQLYHSHCWKLNPNNAVDTSEQTPATTPGQTNIEIGPAPSAIGDVCSFESLTTKAGHNACWEICEPVSCCWRKDVTSCASESNCNGYYMCFGLNGINFDKVDDIEWEEGPEDGPVGGSSSSNNNSNNADDFGVTQEDVQEACSRIILDECEALCEPASCCATGTCSGVKASIDCDVYRACDVLY